MRVRDYMIILLFYFIIRRSKLKDISNFLRIFKLQEIIESILLLIVGYLLIDMFNIPTFFIEKYEISIIIALMIITIFLILNKKIINLVRVNVLNYLDLLLISSLIATTVYVFLVNSFCIVVLN